MTTRNAIDEKTKYIRLLAATIGIITVVFGAIGAYMSDRSLIMRNREMIEHNIIQIQSVKDEFKDQRSVLQEILIKVTRLETTVENRKI